MENLSGPDWLDWSDVAEKAAQFTYSRHAPPTFVFRVL
jgi:hypothetical protein